MRSRSGRHVQGVGHGALAGIMGAACMTVLRSAARRRGLIENTVPQLLGDRLSGGHGGDARDGRLVNELLHLGMGAFQGGVYGALAGRRPTVMKGLTLGFAAWIFGSGIVLPLSGASGGLWTRGPLQNVVDLAAHLSYGAATVLVRGDLSAHVDTDGRAGRGAGREG